MKKIYFYETDPEPQICGKMVENINGKIVSQTPWMNSEKLNGDSQKIMSKAKNEIPEMLEQEIEEFVSQLTSSGMKIKY